MNDVKKFRVTTTNSEFTVLATDFHVDGRSGALQFYKLDSAQKIIDIDTFSKYWWIRVRLDDE